MGVVWKATDTRLDEAIASYRRSLALDPGNANAVSMIEEIRSM